jgi:homogentisate 1,2-dioxygenase
MANAKTLARNANGGTITTPELRYQSGFGNEFASEAVEGTLPQGQNAPQKVANGLYTEQLSGTPFTAPRGVNRRTWLYRLRPSVAHKPFEAMNQGRLRSAPFDEVPTPPNQLRWTPMPIPPASENTDFIDGLITMAGNGNTQTHTGVAIHIYVANASMTDRFFYNADGEMLIVPQTGRLRLCTEMGVLVAGPGEIAVIQRGIRFRVELIDNEARGYICENYGALLRLPDLGPIGANGLANPRDFLAPVASFEDREGDFRLVSKFQGRLW